MSGTGTTPHVAVRLSAIQRRHLQRTSAAALRNPAALHPIEELHLRDAATELAVCLARQMVASGTTCCGEDTTVTAWLTPPQMTALAAAAGNPMRARREDLIDFDAHHRG